MTTYMKKLMTLIILILLFILKTDTTSAFYDVVQTSATLARYENVVVDGHDERVIILNKFLSDRNSPLSDYSNELISYADEYNLDWRLVAAISGVESGFGKHIPANSYNAYGWANGKYSFSSWGESIEVVSKALRERYIDRGATSIEAIGKIYAPPSATWSGKVTFFMNQIEPLPIEFTL